MKIAFVTADEGGPSTGGNLRGRGFVAALQRGGACVTPIYVRGRSRRAYGFIGRKLDCRVEGYDVVHLDGLYLAPLALQIPLPTVLDICDSPRNVRLSVASGSMFRRLQITPGLLLSSHLLQVGASGSDVGLYCSDYDAGVDAGRLPPHLEVRIVPNGVPEELMKLRAAGRPRGHRIGMAGDWSYPANIAGLRWFLGEIWPLLAQAYVVYLFGPDRPDTPLPDRVYYAGYAPTLSELYESIDIVVAPLRAGGGVKNKVLEGIAAGKPVVATSKALEGLESRVASDVLCADKPSDFARAISSAGDATEESLDVAQRRVAEHYSWQRSANRLFEAYERALASHKRRVVG